MSVDLSEYKEGTIPVLDEYIRDCRSKGMHFGVALCDDIPLVGLHYRNYAELRDKWNERKQRIVWDNIRIVMTERDGCTLDDIKRFDRLPYKKVVFVHKPMPTIQSSFYLKDSEAHDAFHPVRNVIDMRSEWSIHRLYDDFDYFDFICSE